MQLKYSLSYLFNFLIISVFFNCKNDIKNDSNLDNESVKNFQFEDIVPIKIDSSKTIKIFGKSDDRSALEYLNLLNFSNMAFSPYNNPEERILNEDSLKLTLYDIKQPQLMDLIAFTDKKNKTPYFTRVLVSPGDSIKMDVKNGKIHFSGVNEAHYNFFLKMNDPLRQHWAIYQQDPFEYKSNLKKSYKYKDSLLKDYVKENPNVSDDFKNLVGSELKFEYLYNLMLPRNVAYPTNDGTYINSNNSIIYEYGIQNMNQEKFLDIEDYFENISIEDFKRPELINNDYFKRSLIIYIRNLFANHDYLEYSRRNFLNEKKFIQENLNGEIETYAIGMLINDYYMKGFGQGQEDVDILKNLIREYKDSFAKKPSYALRMNDILDELKSFNFELNESILNEKLIALNGDTITLKEIFNKTPNNIKVIDFWASWCGPCIAEFKKGKKFKNRIAKDENLSFLYFSIDENKNNWLQKVSDLKEHISDKNQYLILNQQKSKILKLLLIKESSGERSFSIPRYSIIDEKYKIISNNAPRPSDSLTFEKIIKDSKLR